MSSIVLDNSFKTLSPFIDALVNKMSATVCSSQPLSLKQVSVGQRSQTGVASKFILFINYVIIRHHRHVRRIDNCIEQLIVN